MRIGSRGHSAAVHHLANVAAREADVAQEVVVELQQVGIGLPALGATEQGRDHAHLVGLSVWDLASPPGTRRLMLAGA